MEEAKKRIKDWIDAGDKTATLDLSKLGLVTLPELPEGLYSLICNNNNNLTTLPELPDTLILLYCNNNKLTSLPKLPDTELKVINSMVKYFEEK